jgi:glutamate/tyrosine decarboxylase-like PLP-dependent enzyme
MTTPSALDRAHAHALAFLDQLDDRPVAARAGVEALRARFMRPLPEAGCDPAMVVDELVAAADPGIHTSAGGRFFGWVIGGALEAAVAADWLTSVWDQNAGAYACGPSAAIVEEAVGAWLKDLIGLPRDASFGIVTGCQMAHVTCLLAARHALLERQGWDVEAKGLFGAPPIRVFTSDTHHASVDRAVRIIGLGSDCITSLESDAAGRLQAPALAGALAGWTGPAIAVLQAGELCTGVFDDFETLVPIAQQAGAWVHVDGAIGLLAAASRTRRHLVRGVERADSWATDGHKWLNTPYDCGLAFTAHPEAHRAALTQQASYIAPTAARDQLDWNPEFSRRARGFVVYAALRQLGRNGVEALVDRTSDHCAALTQGVAALKGVELLAAPVINQGLVRFLDPSPAATDPDHDRRTDEVIAAICAGGEAFFGGATWRGRRAMRISVSNWRTTDDDVRRSIAAVAQALGLNEVA